MIECSETYHPITRPPANPSVRSRKTSRDHMRNNPNALNLIKKTSKRDKVVRKQERMLLTMDSLALEKSTVERSSSWNNIENASLNHTHRSLSASNLYALTDPNLSLKQAVAKKAYDKPNTSFAKEKALFTAWTQKYFRQLTVGCGNPTCLNIFCFSSSRKKNFCPSMLALVSIELSTYGDQHLCIKDDKKQKALVLNDDLFEVTGDKNYVPFLHKFYSASPFRSLFLPCPLTPSGLGLNRTHSHSELGAVTNTGSVVAQTMKHHLSVIANTISSSLSNIWRAAQQEPDVVHERVQFCDIGPENTKVDVETEAVSEQQHKKIVTRTRLPSVRIFGESYAVDTDENSYGQIDEFETSVAEEFTSNAINEMNNQDIDEDADATNEMVDGVEDDNILDGYSLTHLTLEMFDTVIASYHECEDELFLTNTIRTVFSSWEALNLSFSYEGLKNTSSFAINLNVADVEQMFKNLMELDHAETFIGILIDTVQVMLLGKKTGVSNPSDLKPLAIILEIPSFFDHYSLVLQVATMTSLLSKRCRNAFVSYLSIFSKEKFSSFVQGFKTLLCAETNWNTPSLKSNPNILCLCEALRLLYCSNNYNGMNHSIFPNADFYCKDLTSKVDFKQEYIYWKASSLKDAEDNPKDSILNYAFLLEPPVKVQVMHIDAITQMREEYQDAIVHQARVQQVQKSWSDFNDSSSLSSDVRSAMCPYLLLEIRRENFVDDTLKQLQEKSSDFKKPLKIKYTNSGEQGLDMGGLQKEFFQVIVEKMFDPNFSLFTLSEDGHQVWFNGFSTESSYMFECVGILLGLAIYNGIIIDVRFPLLVYKKLLGFAVGLDDLSEIQPTLCNGLEQVLSYDGDVENDFCLTFEVSHALFGETIKTELITNGANTMVTNDNRRHFVDLYVNFVLNSSMEKQFDSFKRGFFQVCDTRTINLFTPPELELLICGSPELDFKALEKVTEYKDGFTKTHTLMIEFWEIVHGFTFQQKQALLMFVTGSFRVPLKGLGAMSFYIQRNGPDSKNLPTSMTCFNRLLLPEYDSAEKLKSMLLLAIENSKGFGLT